jgi:hypothetical protein
MHPDELFSILRPANPTRVDGFFYNSLVLEFVFWAAVLVLTAILLKVSPYFFEKIEHYGKSLSQRTGLVVVLMTLAALSLRAGSLILVPYPVPKVHDEFSYLLQGETFASGRLTNPTPAGWEHLETFHVNMRPSYQSMYPPGQALFMAAAEVVGAHPWWGIWLSLGLMCGAVCWALQGWVPPQWALLGGLFCVIRFSTFSYWVNTYLGGTLAALGGALVLGSLPRLKRHPRARYGILFALGLVILANSRPYEGLIFSAVPLLMFLIWLVREWPRREVKLVLIPVCSILVAGAIAIAYYNWRGTGNPMLMPYVANQQQYHITKPFIWQTRYPIPEYRQQVMRTFYVYHELPDYLNRANRDGYSRLMSRKLSVFYEFFIWPMIIPTIFAAWVMMKSRKMRIIPLTLLCMLGGLLVEEWALQAQYAAPALAAVLLVVIYGLRLAWTWQPRGLPLGPMLVRSAVLIMTGLSVASAVERMVNPYELLSHQLPPAHIDRARIVSQLERIPGQHLVFVHHEPWDAGAISWIYNDPDLNHSRILWAHDMGDADNEKLIRLYPNRRVWRVDKDYVFNLLRPYSPSDEPAELMQAAYTDSGVAHAQ